MKKIQFDFITFLLVAGLFHQGHSFIIQKSNETVTPYQACQVPVSGGGLGDPQPLFIIPGTSELFLPTDQNGIMDFDVNQPIEMHCSVNFASPVSGGNFVTPTCVSGTTFNLNGQQFPFNEHFCTAFPRHTAQRTGRTCDSGRAEIVEIGFPVDNRYFQIMDVCHDAELASNLYVYFKLSPKNAGFQRAFPRPGWVTGGFHAGLNADRMYSRAEQELTFARILGSAEIAHELVASDPRHFISRGHMAAMTDFIFGLHQRASFYFLNAAPQWMAFNGGNWERVEFGLRTMIANRNIEIDCYTGTHGIMTHPDVNGIPRELYLHIDNNGVGRIPVPKIYYKVVYEPATLSGIVLIGVNNPHIGVAEILRDYVFCEDVSDGIDWLNWDRHNLVTGYMYACEYNEFAAVVGHLPSDIVVTSLLL